MKRVKTDDPNSVDIFINALKNNQIIAYPTDTIYGLGTDINNNEGIDRINSIKMRKQPMSIALGSFSVIKNHIIANENEMVEIKEILKDGSTCIVPYIPGSLNDKIAKDGKIGFRIPNHEYLKTVLNEYKQPITTTSINKTGSEPLYIPDEIEEHFGDKIDLLIDDGMIKNSPSKIFIFEKNEIKRIR
jgi:L-threonylcarbamoyladenylate synthase